MIVNGRRIVATGIWLLASLLFAADTQQTTYQDFVNSAQQRSSGWSRASRAIQLEMTATVKRTKNGEAKGTGVLQWIDDSHYQIDLRLGSERKVIVRDGARIAEFPTADVRLSPQMNDLDAAISVVLPRPDLQGLPVPVRVRQEKVNGRKLLCMEQPTLQYCIDPETRSSAYQLFGSVEFDLRDQKEFLGSTVPTSFRAYIGQEMTMQGSLQWSEAGDGFKGVQSMDGLTWREYQDSCSADAPKRVRISSGVAAHRIISKVQPLYPASAKIDRVMGRVILKAILGKDGSIQEISIANAPRQDLADAALRAVRLWRYLPYFLCGNPVEVETQVEVTFTLVG